MPVKSFPFLIGSDPEFNLLFQDKRLHASEVMKKACKNVEWKDMGWKTAKMKGDFGYDGCDSTGEIRPDPADTVDGCIENMKSILKEAAARLPAFSLSTLSIYAPIGGHIHLDYPAEWGDTKLRNAVWELMSFYLPIGLSENPISRAVRIRSYGNVSDYKIMEHEEGKKSIEIRCPSAEWLTTEETMRATLAYIGTVWNEILNHENKFRKNNKILMKNKQQLEAMFNMAISEHPLMIETLFKHIKSAVRTFEFYDEYKKDIELLFNPKKIIKLKADCGFDIFVGWKLKKKTGKIFRTKFLSQKTVKKELETKHLSDDLVRDITLPFNDDKNVEPFARALESRMLALNWKPKNRYYLYGVRKGIGTLIAGRRINDLNDVGFYFGAEIAKNAEDKQAMERSLLKMSDRAMITMRRETIFDSKKGLVVDNRDIVAIGIPYEWRGEKITKTGSLLQAVWEIENDKAVTEIEINSGKNSTKEEGGEVAKALNDEENINPQVFVDSSSQGVEFANRAIYQLRNEYGDSLHENTTISLSNLKSTSICAE